MISDLDQFTALKELFLKSISHLKPGSIKHGVMFELPSACWQANEILQKADFASIGTNDLIEHLFGFNRDSDEAYTAASHPVLWETMESVVTAAKQINRSVVLCGELARRSEFLHQLIALGINGISVTPEAIPELRQAIAAYYEMPSLSSLPASGGKEGV